MTHLGKILDLDRDIDENWARQSWTFTLFQKKNSYLIHRIVSELSFAKEVSRVNDNIFDDLLELTSKELYDKLTINGSLVLEDILSAENKLKDIIVYAKQYQILYASHAHIDINWLWGYHETVNIAVDTFRTMLDLLNEDSDFIFSQSQALLYSIIKEHNPKMFAEIKQRIKEGRWEVTASTWVEGDKNMANSESQTRQILYAKNYLSESLDIDVDDIVVDFEPDTFGHVDTIPELLNNGGVKYYYHSRGVTNVSAFVYQAKSGKQIINYRDPKSYMMGASGKFARNVVSFSEKTSLKTILGVYGVCDHGGGPTRKDIDMIQDMKTWPIFPNVEFSTYRKYFEYLEENKSKLPVLDNELNFVFTGCYTSQSRIKLANRISENALYDSELLATIANLETSFPYNQSKFQDAWLNTLTSQFHDILPGSGITFTREYALGKFQDTIAYALSQKKNAMEELTCDIDTSKYEVDNSDYYNTSVGAGVGFNSETFKVSKVSRGIGENRIYHIFNTLPYDRQEYIEVFVWNYEADIRKIMFEDSCGNSLQFVRVPNPKVIFDANMKNDKQASYWGHWYETFKVLVNVSGLGYETIVLKQNNALENVFDNYLVDEDDIPRVEAEREYILENKLVKITFDPDSLKMISYIDKDTNAELIGKEGSGFLYTIEDTSKGMDSWVVGRDKSVSDIIDTSNIDYFTSNELSYLAYEAKINDSIVKVNASLTSYSKRVVFNVNVEWRELGNYQKEVPRLSYQINTNSLAKEFKYDVSFGVTTRKPSSLDAAGLSFVAGKYEKFNLFITTDSKYGYKATEKAVDISLIRSSTDPDKYPEIGDHSFKFAVGPIQDYSSSNLIKTAKVFNHPLDTFMGKVQTGTKSLNKCFISIEGDVILSSIKKAEDNKATIIRLYEVNGKNEKFSIRFNQEIKEVYNCDILERNIEKVEFNKTEIKTEIKPYSIMTLKVLL